MISLKGKKVAMIIASQNFRDEELFEPKKVLEDYGASVSLASSSLSPARGVRGGTAKPNLLLEQVKVANFDAVVFVGGAGASEYFNNPQAHLIAKETANVGKVLAAICIAPSTLANAGVLKGKKVTAFASEEGNLKAKGAIWTGSAVEADGNIITANGPGSAKAFGEAIAKALSH